MKLTHKFWMPAVCLALVFSLLAGLLALRAGATAADDYEATMLGSLSEKYEASGDPGRISSGEGDPGGKSYGAYQFASNYNIPKNFFTWCQSAPVYRSMGDRLAASYWADGETYGASFDDTWRTIASEDPSFFLQAQYAYTRKTYYDGAIAELKANYPEFDISNYSIALRNVIYSRSVQIGVGSVPTLFGEALALLGGKFVNQPEAELIHAIYQANSLARTPNTARPDGKTENVMTGPTAEKYGISGLTMDWFWGSSSDVQLGVYSRLHINEPAKAQQMLADYGYTDAPLVEGVYQFSPGDNASLAALVSGSGMVLNAPDANATSHQFRLVFYASGYYTITSVTNGLRLTGNADGSVTLNEASADNNQLWKLELNTETGRYTAKNRATELYLSATSMSAGGTVLTAAEAAAWQLNKSTGAWTLSGASYPSYANGLQVGQSSYQFLGTLRCSYPILTVTARVLNSNGSDAFSPVTASGINALSYDLSNMNSPMAFSRLGAGAYKMVLTATADAPSGNQFYLESDFYVSDGDYPLTFDACGGTGTESSRDLLPGQAYGTLPTATKPGYIFLGWFTAAEGGTQVDSATIMTAGPQTVYAHYEPALTYTFVNFDGSTVYAGELRSGSAIPAPPNTPTRPSDETYYYVFTGWEGYTADMTISENVTFTALYEAKELVALPEMDTSSFVIRDAFLRSIPLGTSTADLLADLVPVEYISLHAGTSTATDIVGTGMTVEYKVGVEVKQSLTIVVTGDVNGDGKITITDLVQINSHLLKKNELGGAHGSAADVNADGKITITDLVQINSHLLKKTSVTPN